MIVIELLNYFYSPLPPPPLLIEQDTIALTAYAVLLFCRDKLDDAESFFKGAVDLSNESPLAWAALATLYASQGRERDAKRAFKQAASLSPDPDSLRLLLAESVLPLCAESMAEVALSQHALAKGGEGSEPLRARICRARARAAAHRHEEAVVLFEQLVVDAPERADLRTELGHALFCAGQHAMWTRSRDAALRACKLRPSASTWLAVGKACAALSSSTEAEEALSEACVLNNRDHKVWAHLCLLTLRLGRRDEAAHSLRQALRLGLADAALLERLGAALLHVGDWASGQDVLQRAVAAGGGPKAERLLADAMGERGLTAEAISLYEKARGGSKLESEARHIKARLEALHELSGTRGK
ncbi:hypothetical protein T492DRAFT_216433 [Pavlovales sp. CCMP2436]|nr:hypothetical protein T492DRAFT_216433 [Pavlovales sp. CCMP2436]